jgi:hypothetical protein
MLIVVMKKRIKRNAKRKVRKKKKLMEIKQKNMIQMMYVNDE